jgi:hypothetical protein
LCKAAASARTKVIIDIFSETLDVIVAKPSWNFARVPN